MTDRDPATTDATDDVVPDVAAEAAADATAHADPAPGTVAASAEATARSAAPPAEGPDGEAADADGGEEPAEVEDLRSPDQLRAELVEAEARRDEYLDDLRRARAEFENYRRRTTREAAAARDAGRADVVGALLEVLDDLDRTREAADGSSDETLAKGVALVTDKLGQALQGQGLTRVDATGVPFDPAVHEAVQQVEADEPTDEPQVHTVLRPGYRIGDRTLRAAMVVVAG